VRRKSVIGSELPHELWKSYKPSRVISRLSPIFVLCFLAPPLLEAAGRTWQTGQLVVSQINANGPNAQVRSRNPRGDLWWTYTLFTKDHAYVAVSRQNPARAGLNGSAPVKFFAENDRIYLLDPHGKLHILKIIRQDKVKH